MENVVRLMYNQKNFEDWLGVWQVLKTKQICICRIELEDLNHLQLGNCYEVQDPPDPSILHQVYNKPCIVNWCKFRRFQCEKKRPSFNDLSYPLIEKKNVLITYVNRNYVRFKEKEKMYSVLLDAVPKYFVKDIHVNFNVLLCTPRGFRGNMKFVSATSTTPHCLRKRKKIIINQNAKRKRMVELRSPVLCLHGVRLQWLCQNRKLILLSENSPSKKFCSYTVKKAVLQYTVRVPDADYLCEHIKVYKCAQKNLMFWRLARNTLFMTSTNNGCPKQFLKKSHQQKNLMMHMYTNPSCAKGQGRLLVYNLLKKYGNMLLGESRRKTRPVDRVQTRLSPPSPCSFICPLLYAWLQTKLGAANSFGQLFGHQTFEEYVDVLIRKGILVHTIRYLREYLERLLDEILVPLFGEANRLRGFKSIHSRIVVTATLVENKISDVQLRLQNWINLSKHEVRHVQSIIKGEDWRDIKRVLNLREPKYIDVEYRENISPIASVLEMLNNPEVVKKRKEVLWKGTNPRAPSSVIFKEELVNIRNLRDVQKILQCNEKKERNKGFSANRHVIEQYKSNLHFVRATLNSCEPLKGGVFGTRSVEYKKKAEIGRLYPAWPSFTMGPSRLRHYTCTEHTDIDIKNCHPVLLIQILERIDSKMKPEALREYINNRETVISELSKFYGNCGRVAVKNFMLRLLNGGGVKNWKYELEDENVRQIVMSKKEEHPFIVKLIPELKHARTSLIRTYYGDKADVQNLSLFSYCLQQIECVCLWAINAFFEKKMKIKVDSLVYDGVIVRSKNVTPEQLRQCEQYVLEKTSYCLTLAAKPFPVVDL